LSFTNKVPYDTDQKCVHKAEMFEAS